MRTLRSYLKDQWVEGAAPSATLHDATTGEAIAEASTRGLDFGAALAHARSVGGPALRAMTFAERGAMLKAMADVIHANREALIDVSRHGGTTRSDAKFDIDGASATLSWYAYLGKTLGEQTILLDGKQEKVLRSARFVSQHVHLPRHGAAIHINAFNFPAWGTAEKAAAALLAGVPVVTKPATATSALTESIVALWVDAGVLPAGALSLICGSAGDLLDHVGPQDCLAFTGGSETARRIRGHEAVIANNVRVNIEADSLNAWVVGPGVDLGSDTFQMFVNQLVRDLTQKCGQKCTAVRRVLIPEALADGAVEALVDRLSAVVVGDPAVKGTEIGPAATASQQQSVRDGIGQLSEHCQQVWQAEAVPEGGYYVTPSLFRSDRGVDTPFVHEHEVFGPVCTVLTWDGSASGAIEMVAAGGGGLVCSVYSDDKSWGGEVVMGLAPWHGRVHWGSRKVHDQSPGPGTVLPNLVHGGPGKAGGGEELGGIRGLHFYMQRTAIQADRGLLEKTFGKPAE